MACSTCRQWITILIIQPKVKLPTEVLALAGTLMVSEVVKACSSKTQPCSGTFATPDVARFCAAEDRASSWVFLRYIHTVHKHIKWLRCPFFFLPHPPTLPHTVSTP